MGVSHHYQTVPEYLSALRQLVQEGEVTERLDQRSMVIWHDCRPNPAQPLPSESITIDVATVRAHFRQELYEPYDATIQRWVAAVRETVEQGELARYTVGTRVVSHGHPAPHHHGVITEVDPLRISIRHDDDCCEPGVCTDLNVQTLRLVWRPIPTPPKPKRSAWERILEDDE